MLVKTSLILSIVIDVDHQNSCFFLFVFYKQRSFLLPLWVLIGFLANFHVRFRS